MTSEEPNFFFKIMFNLKKYFLKILPKAIKNKLRVDIK